MFVKHLTRSFILVVAALLLALNACQDYQEQTYNISDIDSTACNRLSDTNFVAVFAPKLGLLDTSWSAGVIDSLVADDAQSIVDSLSAGGFRIDTLGSFYYDITFQGKDDAYYLTLDMTSASAGEWSFYVSNYLTLRLWNTAGAAQELLDDSLPLELVANCSAVAGRFKYSLTPGKYLLEFNPGDQMKTDNFKMVLIQQ